MYEKEIEYNGFLLKKYYVNDKVNKKKADMMKMPAFLGVIYIK